MHKQAGMTLIELVMSIVIVAVAITGVLQVMNVTVAHSADPLLQEQAIAVAEAYLEEILAKSYDDPDGADGEGARSLFDDVDDYDGLVNASAADQSGTAVGGLGGYSVSVSVAPAANINGVDAKYVTVTVNHAIIGPLTLTGYRTDW